MIHKVICFIIFLYFIQFQSLFCLQIKSYSPQEKRFIHQEKYLSGLQFKHSDTSDQVNISAGFFKTIWKGIQRYLPSTSKTRLPETYKTPQSDTGNRYRIHLTDVNITNKRHTISRLRRYLTDLSWQTAEDIVNTAIQDGTALLRVLNSKNEVSLLVDSLRRADPPVQLQVYDARKGEIVYLSQDSYDDENIPKKGKKKYYPFGTPTHNCVPYSKFAHLNNPQTQEFAATLASTTLTTDIPEQKPERHRRALKKTLVKGTNSVTPAADNPVADIPDAEGLEPCTKIACQQVLRSLADIQLKNEVERDEIEDEYERLLQDLAVTEQEIAAAEAKMQGLTEVGSQLEMRVSQLTEKVDTLQNTKDGQDVERNDINGKLMILQTEKNKRARQLEKSMKALSDATWRKKKKEQQENAEIGLAFASSEISDQPIIQADSATVSSLSGVYKTSYNLLTAERVRDYAELPPTVKTLPPFMMEVLSKPDSTDALDKYAKKHYKKVVEHNVKSWEGMEGSLMTASIYSASTHGYGPAIVSKSFDEYNQIRANRSMAASIATPASARVGSLLQSRSNPTGDHCSTTVRSSRGRSRGPQVSACSGSDSLDMLSHYVRSRELSSCPGSRNPKYSTVSMKYLKHPIEKNPKRPNSQQVRLAPLEKTMPTTLPSNQGVTDQHYPFQQQPDMLHQSGVGESGFDSADAYGFENDDCDDLVDATHSVSMFSALSADDSHLQHSRSLSPQPYGAGPEDRKLDPVFYKDTSRYHFGRKHAVGKVRKAEVTWGMQAYQQLLSNAAEGEEDDDLDAATAPPVTSKHQTVRRSSAASSRAGTTNSTRTLNSTKSVVSTLPPPTVKTRSLTVYHPNMHIFQDSASLPKKKVTVV